MIFFYKSVSKQQESNKRKEKKEDKRKEKNLINAFDLSCIKR
jgi:hypothetical protein